MAAARASADPRGRLVVELPARTGMRAGELAGLEAGAVVRTGAGHWLRIPLGKLRNDRYVPLHPELAELPAAWTAASPAPSAAASGWSGRCAAWSTPSASRAPAGSGPAESRAQR
jgi:integrase